MLGATIPYLLIRRPFGESAAAGPEACQARCRRWRGREGRCRFLERCQKHFGDIFTIRVKHAGTWVILADPEDVKKVFTADHAVLGVGLANSILGPLLGPRSVMLLGGARARASGAS